MWLFVQGLMQSKIQGSTKAANHCPCERNPLVTSGFPSQTDSIAKTFHVTFHVWPVPSTRPAAITVENSININNNYDIFICPFHCCVIINICYQTRLMNSLNETWPSIVWCDWLVCIYRLLCGIPNTAMNSLYDVMRAHMSSANSYYSPDATDFQTHL